MRLELSREYTERLNQRIIQQQNDNQKKRKKKQPIFFKKNALNGGKVDWSRTLAYANSPS